MQTNNASHDYVPLLCQWLTAVAMEPAAHTRIAVMLLIACHRMLNAGKFPNALHDWENETIRISQGIGSADWETIKNAKSAFWHFEGWDLVVDFYSRHHEQTMLARSSAARNSALRRWRNGKTKNFEKQSVNANASANANAIKKEISPNGDISKGPSPLGTGGAFDEKEDPRFRPATPEEIEAIFAGIYTPKHAD